MSNGSMERSMESDIALHETMVDAGLPPSPN